MRNISDTIARLSRGRFPDTGGMIGADRLTDLDGFGVDPGNLRARLHVPPRPAERPALVVVLHGCTQSAAAYDHGSGWSRLADERGFLLLFAEQRRENNPNLCFNWFSPTDTVRDQGEAMSIRQMIATVARSHDVDPTRIFVTGLSAGGAMAMAMLAAYPDLFAGGAIIAGLPYGCATSVPEAFERMRGRGCPDARTLGRLARHASSWTGAWPTLSVWHGDADATVAAGNAAAIVGQWRALHDIGPAPQIDDMVDGHPHRVWHDRAGRPVIEEYRIRAMGHGTPIDSGGSDPCGVPGPFMLEAGISSTRHIAAFWGLIETMPDAIAGAGAGAVPAAGNPAPNGAVAPPARVPHPAEEEGVARIINDALRSAGLMR